MRLEVYRIYRGVHTEGTPRYGWTEGSPRYGLGMESINVLSFLAFVIFSNRIITTKYPNDKLNELNKRLLSVWSGEGSNFSGFKST